MWASIIASIVLSLVSFLLMPKPKHEPPEPGELDFPRIDPSANIPVIFGTVHIKDPTIVWYGDLDTVPIMSDQVGKKG